MVAFPDNVTDLVCILCEKRIGKHYKISDGEHDIDVRLCQSCIRTVEGGMDRQVVKTMLDHMVARGLIEGYHWDPTKD